MAASDDLAALADRAKRAEDRVTAAKKQARSDLEKQTAKARDGAQRKAEQLKAQTATAATNASQWWSDVQSTWSEHVAHVREDMDSKKAERDAKKSGSPINIIRSGRGMRARVKGLLPAPR